MVKQMWPPAAPVEPSARPKMPALPHHRIGWLALVLLLVTGLFPIWWATLDDVMPNDASLAAVAAALGVGALAFARAAVVSKKDPSVIVAVLFGLVVFEIGMGVLVVLALLGQAVFS